MILNNNEMLFCNSLAQGVLFHTQLETEHLDQEKYEQEILENVKHSGFVNSDNKITSQGIATTKLLELHKQSDDYLVINGSMVLSNTKDHQLISLIKDVDSQTYSLLSTTYEFYFLNILKGDELYTTSRNMEKTRSLFLSLQELIGTMEEVDNFILIETYTNRLMSNRLLFYIQDRTIYQYNFDEDIKNQVDVLTFQQDVIYTLRNFQERNQ